MEPYRFVDDAGREFELYDFRTGPDRGRRRVPLNDRSAEARGAYAPLNVVHAVSATLATEPRNRVLGVMAGRTQDAIHFRFSGDGLRGAG